MPLHKKVVKKVAKAATKAIGGNPTPSLADVIAVARRYNPVTGPVGAIKQVADALKSLPLQASSTARSRAFGQRGAVKRKGR